MRRNRSIARSPGAGDQFTDHHPPPLAPIIRPRPDRYPNTCKHQGNHLGPPKRPARSGQQTFDLSRGPKKGGGDIVFARGDVSKQAGDLQYKGDVALAIFYPRC